MQMGYMNFTGGSIMKKASLKVGLASLLLIGAANAQNNVLNAQETAQGFQLLFDGTIASFRANFVDYIQNNTTNTGLNAGWTVNSTDQSIVTTGNTPDVRTRVTYRDTDIRMDYKNPGNQGVCYRHFVNQPNNWYTGVELAIDNNLNQNTKVTAGAAYDTYAPIQPNPYNIFSTGLWNALRIVAKGDSVEHWMNGVKVVGFRYNTASFWTAVAASKWTGYPSFCLNIPGDRASGYIQAGYFGFQGNHGGAWNIRNFRFLNDTRGTVTLGPIPVPTLKGEAAQNQRLELKLSRQELRIQFSSTDVKSLELYDLTGQLLRRSNVASGQREVVLGSHGIRKGLYFLRLETASGSIRRKVFIQ